MHRPEVVAYPCAIAHAHLGQARLEPGEAASLFPEPETPAVVLPGLADWDARTRGLVELDLLAG